MNKLKKGFAFLLVFVLMFQGSTLYTEAADRQYRMNIEVVVDGVSAGQIPALDNNYTNNLFISLKGVAGVLRGTGKAFVPVVERRKINITTGAGVSQSCAAWNANELAYVGIGDPSKYELWMNGAERKYYSFIVDRNGDYDAFMTPISLALLFDLDMKVTEHRIEIDTTAHYSVTAQEMEESGYLQCLNALLIGDGSTGEIYYQYGGDATVAIASTTKLMTYLVFMDAVTQGKCSLDDTVVISAQVSRLSNGSDGVVPMRAGSKVPVRELLYAMLLPSSNECAMALAEHAAGSEEAFVAQMNDKAKELGLDNAEFYNCHGLPSFGDQLIPAKVQNHMTAEEMFKLVSFILDTYPQVTQFTSAQKYHMKTFNLDLKNSNAVLYNMDNAVGLKTGTTNKAGCCLVTCVTETKDGKNHNLITVLFGADGDEPRGIASEMAARYAMKVLQEKGPDDQGGQGEKVIPSDPEMVVRKLISIMK